MDRVLLANRKGSGAAVSEDGLTTPYRTLWAYYQLRESLGDCKKRARLKGIPFSLNIAHVQKGLNATEGRCWVSGIQFKPCQKDFFRNPYRPSFDRIDPKKGYTPDNVRIVAYCVNAAMNEWGLGVLAEIVGGFGKTSDCYKELTIEMAGGAA